VLASCVMIGVLGCQGRSAERKQNRQV